MHQVSKDKAVIVMGNTGPSRINNFDLIRLLAAIQVFVGHAFLIKFFRENWVYDIIWFVPGVPIFFGMSGFLLLWSFERHSDLPSYFKNRFLRLYPALWLTMVLTTVILLAFGTVSLRGLFDPSFLMYFFGRCTIIFYFVPSIVKGFAQGNPNGSLWTIGVELQFYFLLPLIYLLIRKRRLYVKNIILIGIGFISYWIDRHDPEPPFNVSKLNGYLQILVSEFRILYYLFFFIVGMLCYVNYRYLGKLLEGRFVPLLLFYIAISALTFYYCDLSKIDRYAPDPVSLLRHLCLMLMVFSAAFTRGRLAEKLLKGNDYSYGIYLVHLLILNSFYQLHLFNGLVNFIFAGLLTGILAFLSWRLVEKRALRLKKHPLRTIFRKPMGRIIKYTNTPV
jgi:peptidoglycan/LPS O-acetylase OafA/YrhL